MRGKGMKKAFRIYYKWVNSSKSLDSDTSKLFRSTFLFVFFLFLLEASESVSCTSAETILTLFFVDSVAGFGLLGSEFAGEAWGRGVCGREGRLSDWFL